MCIEFQKVYIKNSNNLELLLDLLNQSYVDKYFDILSHKDLSIVSSFLKIDTIKNEIRYDNKTYYLLSCEENLIGYIELQVINEKLFLNNFYLVKEFCNMKYFSCVFEFIFKYCNDNKSENIISYIPIENVRYLNIYRKFGFCVTKQVARYFGSGIYVYCYQVERLN